VESPSDADLNRRAQPHWLRNASHSWGRSWTTGSSGSRTAQQCWGVGGQRCCLRAWPTPRATVSSQRWSIGRSSNNPFRYNLRSRKCL
jgi:hypothetical protein